MKEVSRVVPDDGVSSTERVPERSRYLDTASLSYFARYRVLDEAPSSRPSRPPESDATIVYFAPNTTQALLPILEYAVRSMRVALVAERPVHPVIRELLVQLQPSAVTEGQLAIHTLVDWITGGVSHWSELSTVGRQMTIIDAVQGFGLLAPDELDRLLRFASSGAIVAGCLHKWCDSAFPVGFALIPRTLLDAAPELRRRLALTDYLGASLQGERQLGYFIDTFSSNVGARIGRALTVGFDPDSELASRHRQTISENRAWLVQCIAASNSLSALPSGRDGRGFIAVTSDVAVLAQKSADLRAAGFEHTFVDRSHSEGRPYLRLSAPTVAMSPIVSDELESLLA